MQTVEIYILCCNRRRIDIVCYKPNVLHLQIILTYKDTFDTDTTKEIIRI